MPTPCPQHGTQETLSEGMTEAGETHSGSANLEESKRACGGTHATSKHLTRSCPETQSDGQQAEGPFISTARARQREKVSPGLQRQERDPMAEPPLVLTPLETVIVL